MKKIITTLFILTICLAFASATLSVVNYNDPVDTSSYPMDNWLGRIFSNFKMNSDSFTVYGDELGCGVTPGQPSVFSGGIQIGVSDTDSVLINWFRGSPENGFYPDHPSESQSRQFIGEIYLGVGGVKSTVLQCDAGAYWNNQCYYEIYWCPAPCFVNSDCTSGQACEKSVLSNTASPFPTGAGVCKASNPTHSTQVYNCENNVKTSLGSVKYGNSNFCTNPSASKYLIGSTDRCLTYIPDECKSVTPSNPNPPEEPTTNPVCGDGTCNGNELCTTCVEDCGACPSGDECNTEADLDCNGAINIPELTDYITKWKTGQITRDELGIVLDAWSEQ